MKKNNKVLKGITIIIALAILMQITSIFATQSNEEELEENAEVKILEPDTVDPTTIIISDEVKQMIISSSGENYIDVYKNFLVELNVQSVYKDLIESFILEGYRLEDILIAYEYLADHYSKSSWLEQLLNDKKSGKTWEQLFKNYIEAEGAFVPSNFDQEYLEELLNVETITPDDIMISDRIAQSLDVPFQDIINQRLGNLSFKQICMDKGALGSADRLSRVQITMEELNKYTDQGMQEETVIEAYVLASKVKAQPKDTIEKMKQGMSYEKIFADYLVNKYN